MTCRCSHEFCWLCLGDWKKHGSDTGGFNKCNIYSQNTKKFDNEQDRAKAKMKKFKFYVERHEEHLKSLEKNLELKNKQLIQIKNLMKIV